MRQRRVDLCGAFLPVQGHHRPPSRRNQPLLPAVTKTVNPRQHPGTSTVKVLQRDSHVLPPTGEELIEEIMLVRGERKQLEWTRQELLRKGKDLLSQNRHRRNQGQREMWNLSAFFSKVFPS